MEVQMRGAGVLAMLLFSSAAWADYKLNLVGTTTALAASGQSIQLTGGGSFDPDAQSVTMSGSFVVLTQEGVAIRRGTWKAHHFDKFTSWKSNHELGGVLEVMATLVSENGVLDQQRMKFICLVGKPASFGEDEGVTVGPFLEAAGGVVRFLVR
jgi:hypothetical protein